jgi:hypothetical protein
MPDGFQLGTLPSMVALRLVGSQRYRLVPLPFADAFRLNALIEEAPREGPASEIDSRCVTDTIIPAYTYRRAPPIPPEPMHTLGTRLLLLSNDRVPPNVVERMLDAVFHSRLVQASHPPLDRSTLHLPLRPHPGRVSTSRASCPS